MQKIIPTPNIYVSTSKIPDADRGVFAVRAIKKDEVIEVCPVVVLPAPQTETIRKTDLLNYYFMWGEGLKSIAIALGYGSLYNHSYSPNATYEKVMESSTLKIKAIKLIAKDEEITVNYNYGNPEDQSPLWIASIK